MSPINLQFQVTPEGFQSLRKHFAQHDVEVPDAATGVIEQDGVKARFSYDGETLEVQIYDKPWVYPESKVIEKLTEFIESSIV